MESSFLVMKLYQVSSESAGKLFPGTLSLAQETQGPACCILYRCTLRMTGMSKHHAVVTWRNQCGHHPFLCRKGVSDSAGFQWILRSMRNPRDHGIVRVVSFGERPLEKQLETKSIACPPQGKQSGLCWLTTVLNSECGLVIDSVPIRICCFHGSVTWSTVW